MNLQNLVDTQSLALESAKRIRAFIEQKPDALFCFAAGRTQIPTYQILSKWSREGELDISRLRVIGLDEILGASRANREGFRFFLDTNLFDPAGFREEQIEFFNAQAKDEAGECARIDAWLNKNGPIDFLLLGIGLNGHIGYNEPGAKLDERTHTVALTAESMSVSRQYFDHAFDASRGITLGLADLMAAKTILVQATGADKIPVVQALRDGRVDEQVPVSHLQKRNDVDLFVDQAAYAAK